MSWAIKKVFTQRNVMCDEHGPVGVISKSSFRVKETERRISRGYCRGIGPRGSLPMYVLGPKRMPRTVARPRRGKRYKGSPH